MATDYPFTKAVYIPKLEDEILTSSITGTLDSIELFGIDNLHVWFVSPLSGADETTLNGIVAAHVASYVDTSDDFLRLNTGPDSLGQNPTMDAGLLILRGTNPDGIIKYNETLDVWECGVVGNMNQIASISDLPLIVSFVIEDTTTADAGMLQHKFGQAVTITRVSASTDTGTCTIQFDERVESTPNTGGTDVMTAVLVADTNTEATTAFANANIAADAVLNLDIDAVAASPGVVRIHVEYRPQ